MTQTPITPPAPQAGASGDPQPQAGNPPPTTPQAGKSPDDYERMIAELRKENAGHRTKLKAFEEAEEAAKQAALSEVEKATKRAQAAEALNERLRQENVTALIQLQATARGITSAELIAPYVLAKLEYDDDGKPTNLDKILDEIVKNNPYLVKPEASGGTPLQQRPPATPANNPGRTSIVQPGTPTQGQRVSIFDPGLWKT